MPEEKNTHCQQVATHQIVWAGKIYLFCDEHTEQICQLAQLLSVTVYGKQIAGSMQCQQCIDES